MCGIAGMFAYGTGEPVDRSLLEKMTNMLAHRGPDGSGFHLSQNRSAGLGHRRLSIIDLVTGDQPVSNEDGTVWVNFNGEIYNYRELREELRTKGHRFSTASDSEVIAHAYEEWGTNCALKFNGIFAISLWDERTQSLYLARDHFGVKPLYYHDSGQRFLFASEMKSLLIDSSVPRSIDLDALDLCLTFRHTPSPWTLFAGIRKIPPASYIVVEKTGVRTGTYWSETPPIDRSRSEADWISELAAMYPVAVHRQMISDVPIGLSLSSGVDSNTLLALMSQHTQHVHTFTVGFEGGDTRDDEVKRAVESANGFDAMCETQVIKEADYFDFMESYLWHLEEPIGNESAAAYHFVAKLAKPKVKVLLSGQGADEPFAGYWRHQAARYAPLLNWIPKAAVALIGNSLLPLFGGNESAGRLVDCFSQRGEAQQLLSMYSITTPRMREQLLNADTQSQMHCGLSLEYVRTQLKKAPAGTLLEKMAFIDARTSLPDNLLLCGDKMAMAASVEMRVPFLDLEVMRIAERIPGDMKVRWFRNKVIHKQTCERWLPKEVVNRRKVGFNNPMNKWLNQKLEPLLNDLTASQDSITRTYLNLGTVRTIQEEHKSGRYDHHRLLFLLLSIEMWNKVFAREAL